MQDFITYDFVCCCLCGVTHSRQGIVPYRTLARGRLTCSVRASALAMAGSGFACTLKLVTMFIAIVGKGPPKIVGFLLPPLKTCQSRVPFQQASDERRYRELKRKSSTTDLNWHACLASPTGSATMPRKTRFCMRTVPLRWQGYC